MNVRSFRKRPGQEYPKPENVYEELDESRRESLMKVESDLCL
jgi:hypothetical protein